MENVWFDRLRRSEVEKAFVLTLSPPRPAENDPNLRDQLETLHNSSEELTFTMFPESPHVRAIIQGGPESVLAFQGVRDWSFEAGGYRVRMVYQVTTPLTTGQIQVTVQSHEGGTKDVPGRQWYVVREFTQTVADHPLQPTPQAQKLFALANQGHAYAQNWINRLHIDPAEAFPETLPVAERFQYRQGAAQPPVAREFLDRLMAFRDGSLLIANPPAFWCLAKNRDAILRDMKNAFRREGDQPTVIKLLQSTLPSWKEEGDLIHFRYQVHVQSRKFISEGALVLSGKLLPDGDPAPQSWRVEAIELARGRPAPPEPAREEGPGGPMMRPPRPSPRR